MKFPHALFRRAGLNSTDVAYLLGVSRVTGTRWLSGVDRRGNPGVGVNKFLEVKVAKVANAIMMAVDLRVLPSAEMAKLSPLMRARALNRIVSSLKPR